MGVIYNMTVFERITRETPIDEVDWEKVSEYVEGKYLSISFIREYADYLNWFKISHYHHTTDFYREFADYLDWWNVTDSKINERKIKEFKDRFDNTFDWEQLCMYSKLSKKFVLRNTELVWWDRLFIYQDFDNKFLIANKKRYSDDIDIEIHLRSMGVEREED